MRLFNNIRNYIGENEFKIYLYRDKIDIINYNSLKDINNNKIIIDNSIITGKDLKIVKLLDEEVLITGKVESITFE